MTGVVRYESEVVGIGPMVPAFHETGLIILFGETAPEELHDICVLHRPTTVESVPEPGDVLEIGGETFEVTAVGSVVHENLLRLGHVSLKADGAVQAALPGDVSVEARPMPLPTPGMVFRFIANGASAPVRAPGSTQTEHTEESA